MSKALLVCIDELECQRVFWVEWMLHSGIELSLAFDHMLLPLLQLCGTLKLKHCYAQWKVSNAFG